MTKRLQVRLGESECRDIKKLARRNQMSVSEWVRHAIRAMRSREPTQLSTRKLAAVRPAARHEFPVADVEHMLAEIERAYLGHIGS